MGASCGDGYLEHVDYTNGATNSIGMLYELVTGVLGFHPDDVGKTIGLAGWGRRRFLDVLLDFVQFCDSMDDVFRFNTFDGRLERTLLDLLDAENRNSQTRADLAA